MKITFIKIAIILGIFFSSVIKFSVLASENKTSFKFNDENYLTFNTRRNRKIDLTEYYNLIYEYKNDCLIAGIKYNKSYYEDRDLKPSENLLFTISLVPLTTYEYEADKILGN